MVSSLPPALVKASSTPMASWVEIDANPPLNPTLTALGDGTKYWTTRLGTYTFDKAKPYVFSYKDHFGTQLVDSAQYWLLSTDTLDPAKINGFTVITANNTMFKYSYNTQYKGGGLSKDAVIGTFIVTWIFYNIDAPKQTVVFNKNAVNWGLSGLGDYTLILDVLPTEKFFKTTDTSAVDLNAYSTTVQLLDNVLKCEVSNSSDVIAWSRSLGVFWDDYSAGCLVLGGAEKVFGGKGFLVVFPVNASIIDPKIYEYYNTGDDNYRSIYDVKYAAQTFTVGATNHYVTALNLMLYRTNNAHNTMTYSIRAVDVGTGKPTGGDLTSGTIDPDDAGFTTNSAGAWYMLSVTTYELTAATKYAIVVKLSGGSSSVFIGWRLDTGTPNYVGGQTWVSTDSGSTWTGNDFDQMFEVWGHEYYTRTASQALGVGSTTAELEEWLRASTQTVTMGVAAAKLAELTRASTQAITAAFTTAKLVDYTRVSSAAFTLAPNTARLIELLRTASQAVTVGTAVTLLSDFLRTASQTLTVSNAATALRELIRAAAQGINITSSTQRLNEFLRDTTQAVAVASQATRVFLAGITLYTRDVAQSITVGSAVNVYREVSRIASLALPFNVSGALGAIEYMVYAALSFTFARLLGVQVPSGSQLTPPTPGYSTSLFLFIIPITLLLILIIKKRPD